MDTKPYISFGFISVGAVLLAIGLTWSHLGRDDRSYPPIARGGFDRSFNERPTPASLPPQELATPISRMPSR